MSFDYNFEIESGDEMAETTYQRFVEDCGIGDEIVCGAPLKQGGTPQAAFIKGLIERAPGITKVRVFFQGNEIL